MSDDNESSEDHVDDSCSSEDDSLNPDDRSVISVDIDDDDYEDLTKSALNSLLQHIEFDSLSPTSKNRASCQCGECGFDARGSHHSCYECKNKMMVFLIYSCWLTLSLMSFV